MSEAEHSDWVTEAAFIRFIETQPGGRSSSCPGLTRASTGCRCRRL
jgi:hypothetical protein